jgi:hypothetical protein
VKSKPCRDDCGCIPVQDGYYWATCRKYANWGRVIVLLGKNGHGHRRAFVARFGSSYDPSDFADYSKRLAEREGKKS